MLGALPTVFAGLEPDDSLEAAGFLQRVQLEPGEIIMGQGDEDLTMAFIQQGAVQLLDGDVRIGGAGAREMLGELELFGQIPRLATAQASGPVSVQVLAYEHYLELCERGNHAVFNLERQAHRRVSERVRYLNTGIAERSPGEPIDLRPRGTGLLSRLFRSRRTAPPVDVGAELARSELFNWAERAQVDAFAEDFNVEKFDAEQFLCQQGEDGDKMFIIVEGSVDVVVMVGKDRAERLTTLGAGHAFGDASMAQHTPRSASCVCHEDVLALTLARDRFDALFAVNDPIGSTFRQGVLRNMIAQVVAAQQRFVQLDGGSSGHRAEETFRGTPVSTVWRD